MTADTQEQRKAIAAQIQENAWNIVPLLHFGQWIQPAAHRKNVTGWLHDPGVAGVLERREDMTERFAPLSARAGEPLP